MSKFNTCLTFVQSLAACKRFCPGERAVSKGSLLVVATASVCGIIVYSDTTITRKNPDNGEIPTAANIHLRTCELATVVCITVVQSKDMIGGSS